MSSILTPHHLSFPHHGGQPPCGVVQAPFQSSHVSLVSCTRYCFHSTSSPSILRLGTRAGLRLWLARLQRLQMFFIALHLSIVKPHTTYCLVEPNFKSIRIKKCVPECVTETQTLQILHKTSSALHELRQSRTGGWYIIHDRVCIYILFQSHCIDSGKQRRARTYNKSANSDFSSKSV